MTFDVEKARKIAGEGLHSDAVAQLSLACKEIKRLRSELAARNCLDESTKREFFEMQARAFRPSRNFSVGG